MNGGFECKEVLNKLPDNALETELVFYNRMSDQASDQVGDQAGEQVGEQAGEQVNSTDIQRDDKKGRTESEQAGEQVGGIARGTANGTARAQRIGQGNWQQRKERKEAQFFCAFYGLVCNLLQNFLYLCSQNLTTFRC